MQHLVFQIAVARTKPESIVNRSTACPFCDRANLTGFLDEEGPLLLLENKFQVLQEAYQTVLIETDVCDSELSVYPPEHLRRLLRFGVRNWREMQASGKYKSVIFFKNHGPLSGGTLAHPHMQIVGLEKADAQAELDESIFSGLVIREDGEVEFNIATAPKIGFYEFNVISRTGEVTDAFCDWIQVAAHYVLNHRRNCTSYNIFFYNLSDGSLAARIIPRYPTSPIYMGYSIPQVANDLAQAVEDIRRLYFENA